MAAEAEKSANDDKGEACEIMEEMGGLVTAPFKGNIVCAGIFRLMAVVGIIITGVFATQHIVQFASEPLEWAISHDRNDTIIAPAVQICPASEIDLLDLGMNLSQFHIADIRSTNQSVPSRKFVEARYYAGYEDAWYTNKPFVSHIGDAYTECNDSCFHANWTYAEDGECDDGRLGADHMDCAFGSDCTDCKDLGDLVRLNTTTKCVIINDDPKHRLDPFYPEYSELSLDVPFYFDPPGPINYVVMTLYEPGTDPHWGETSYLNINTDFIGTFSVETVKYFGDSASHKMFKFQGQSIPDVQWSRYGWVRPDEIFTGVSISINVASMVVIKSVQEPKDFGVVLAEVGGMWSIIMMIIGCFYVDRLTPNSKRRHYQFRLTPENPALLA